MVVFPHGMSVCRYSTTVQERKYVHNVLLLALLLVYIFITSNSNSDRSILLK